MAYALVGSVGAVTTGTAGNSVTPAWGTSENRTNPNLLLCLVGGYATSSLPAQPANWSTAVQVAGGTACSASLFYKIASGSDAAPTITGVISTILSAQLMEFSGNISSAPLDQTATGSGTTGTTTATASQADQQAGELVIYVGVARYALGVVKTLTPSLNNGATPNDTNNNSTTTANHYSFGWGITTGNSSDDSGSITLNTSNLTNSGLVIASFLLPITITVANAGLAAVSVAAPAPTPIVITTAGIGAVSAAALAPTPSAVTTSGLAAVNVAGLAPAATLTIPAGRAAVTASGLAPVPSLAASAGLAQVAGTAYGPQVSIGTTAGLAAVSASGYSPSGSVRITASNAAVAVAAYDVTRSVLPSGLPGFVNPSSRTGTTSPQSLSGFVRPRSSEGEV